MNLDIFRDHPIVASAHREEEFDEMCEKAVISIDKTREEYQNFKKSEKGKMAMMRVDQACRIVHDHEIPMGCYVSMFWDIFIDEVMYLIGCWEAEDVRVKPLPDSEE